MNSLSSIILIFSFIFCSSLYSKECQKLLSSRPHFLLRDVGEVHLKTAAVGKKKIEYHQLKVRKGLGGYGGIHVGHFNMENSFYLGFSRDGHVYLIAQDQHFDGDFLNKSQLKVAHGFSEGVVVRFESSELDIAEDLSRALRNEEYSSKRNLTCAKGVCDFLKEQGIFYDSSRAFLSPAKFLKFILKNEFLDAHGEPLRKDVIVFHRDPLEKQIKKINRMIPAQFMVRFLKIFFG